MLVQFVVYIHSHVL